MATITWEVFDGYVGKSRPQFVEVPDEDLNECENEDEVNDLIDSYVQHDFEKKISYTINNIRRD